MTEPRKSGCFVRDVPSTPSFSQQGFCGRTFLLASRALEVSLIDSITGHDNYIRAHGITHLYYILEGELTFEADGEKFTAKTGQLVEIPPQVEFVYTGKAKLLLILSPPFRPDAIEETRPNPGVGGSCQ
jgi:quercetin dioxygenase-like cupin family protein